MPFSPLVLVLAVLGVVAALVTLGILAARRGRERRVAAEAQLLARLGGRLSQDAMLRQVIEASVGNRDVRLTRVETSRSLVTWVQARVQAGDLGFDVRPRGAQFVATLGPTLVATGDDAFDENVLAMSPERERLGAILTPEVRQRLVEQARQKSPFWWRLKEGVLLGEIRGSWGSSGFQERCDLALAVLTSLAREVERAR